MKPMLLIPRRNFLLLIFVASLLPAALLVYVGRELGQGTDSKSFFEGAVFLLVLLYTAFLLFLGLMGAGFRSTRQKAEKLLASRSPESIAPAEWKSILGDLGEAFYAMTRLEFETSLGRKHKIDGLNRLLDFLVRNFESSLAVCNVLGVIVYSSPSYAEKAGRSAAGLQGKSIAEVHDGLALQPLIQELRKTHSSKEVKTDSGKLTVYPLVDGRNEISYLVFSMAGRGMKIEPETAENSGESSQSGTGKTGMLERFRKIFSPGERGPKQASPTAAPDDSQGKS